MHGHGKSDRPIVPAKPPNEAEPGEAKEAVEGRGLAKGKAPERNMSGLRAGAACPARLSEYVRQQGGIKDSGSPHFCTMFTRCDLFFYNETKLG